MSKKSEDGVVITGMMLMVVAVVLFLAAIWTYGPNSGRLAGTAAALGIVGGLLVLVVVMDS